MSGDLLGFAVLMTAPASEDQVESALIEAGFYPYVPRYKKRLRGCRIDEHTGRRVRSRRDGFVTRPLFQSYVLVGLHPDDDTYAVGHARGVLRLLRDALNRPRLISLAIVAEIRRRVDSGEFDEIPPDAPGRPAKRVDLNIGDRVQVNAAYGSVLGRLVSLDDAGRGRILLDILSRGDVMATVDAGELVKIA
jgi:hypothetical protein